MESFLRNQKLPQAPTKVAVWGVAENLPQAPSFRVTHASDGQSLPEPALFQLPLSKKSAESLAKHCKVAPFGKGRDTVVDESVRKTLEIAPSQLRIDEPQWNSEIQRLAQQVADQLVGHHEPIEVHLYKMLLYEPGGHFLRHQDTEKETGMFATLVVELPSAHEGGELTMEFNDFKHTYNFPEARVSDPALTMQPCYAAFYCDVHHQVSAVTKGHRLVLSYNICWPSKSPVPCADPNTAASRELARFIEKRFEDVLPLQHEYTEMSLAHRGVDAFKGEDLRNITRIRQANRFLDAANQLHPYVVKLQHKIVYTGEERCYYHRRRYNYYNDESEDESEDESDIDYNWEICDDEGLQVESIFSAEGLDVGEWGDFLDEVHGVVVKYDDDYLFKYSDPDEDIEGYTGNAGPDKVTEYHHYALVLLKRHDILDLAEEHGTLSDIAHVASDLASRQQDGRAREALDRAMNWFKDEDKVSDTAMTDITKACLRLNADAHLTTVLKACASNTVGGGCIEGETIAALIQSKGWPFAVQHMGAAISSMKEGTPRAANTFGHFVVALQKLEAPPTELLQLLLDVAHGPSFPLNSCLVALLRLLSVEHKTKGQSSTAELLIRATVPADIGNQVAVVMPLLESLPMELSTKISESFVTNQPAQLSPLLDKLLICNQPNVRAAVASGLRAKLNSLSEQELAAITTKRVFDCIKFCIENSTSAELSTLRITAPLPAEKDQNRYYYYRQDPTLSNIRSQLPQLAVRVTLPMWRKLLLPYLKLEISSLKQTLAQYPGSLHPDIVRRVLEGVAKGNDRGLAYRFEFYVLCVKYCSDDPNLQKITKSYLSNQAVLQSFSERLRKPDHSGVDPSHPLFQQIINKRMEYLATRASPPPFSYKMQSRASDSLEVRRFLEDAKRSEMHVQVGCSIVRARSMAVQLARCDERASLTAHPNGRGRGAYVTLRKTDMYHKKLQSSAKAALAELIALSALVVQGPPQPLQQQQQPQPQPQPQPQQQPQQQPQPQPQPQPQQQQQQQPKRSRSEPGGPSAVGREAPQQPAAKRSRSNGPMGEMVDPLAEADINIFSILPPVRKVGNKAAAPAPDPARAHGQAGSSSNPYILE